MKVQTIAVIGGTGNLGAALGRRWAEAGHRVIIGSRSSDRAVAAAEEMGHGARGDDYAGAAAAADVVVLAIPFAAQDDALMAIAGAVAGKVVVDTTVPLMPPKVMRVQLPEEGSAAVRTQARLGPDARVVSAFHNVAADKVAVDGAIESDVLVFGDERAARQVAIDLAADAGLRGLHGGPLANSAAAEALTSVLIFMNKTYRCKDAGLRITGDLHLPED